MGSSLYKRSIVICITCSAKTDLQVVRKLASSSTRSPVATDFQQVVQREQVRSLSLVQSSCVGPSSRNIRVVVTFAIPRNERAG